MDKGCIKLDLANTTKVSCRLDENIALVVLVLVVVIVIENPSEQIDYEDEDGSGKAQHRPVITVFHCIAQYAGPAMVNERLWGVAFDEGKYPAHMTFVLGGLEVHIDEQAQALLAGTTLDFVNGKIVAEPKV